MIPLVKPFFPPRDVLMPALEDILYSGYVAEGQPVYDFEDKFRKFIGNENIIALHSGTDALHLSFILAGIKPGDEVIMPSYTFVSTALAFVRRGAKMIFVDSKKNNPNIDENEIGDMPIASYKTSRYKLIVPLKKRKTLDNLKPNFEMLKDLCDKYETSGFYPFAEEDGNYYARQFPKNSGYPEDPATGVAASALGAYILDNQKVKSDGWHLVKIYQGQAMGRPSYIESYNLVKDGKLIENTVCGYADFIDETEKL